MRLAIEYGDGLVEVDVPDDTTVISPDHADHEPPPLPDPIAATREALGDPLGSGPIGDLVGPGGTVTIAFPDRVKGGAHDTAHRDRKSTRLNSSHLVISYAVFCLKKKKK